MRVWCHVYSEPNLGPSTIMKNSTRAKNSSPQSPTPRAFAQACLPRNRRLSYSLFGTFTALATLLASFSLQAKTLDDFNDNVKTGWTDALNGGSVTEAS